MQLVLQDSKDPDVDQFKNLDAKILQKILINWSFSNKRWKLTQKLILRRLSRQWLNALDSCVVSLPIKPKIFPSDLFRIICWFPSLKYFNDHDDRFKQEINNDKLDSMYQLLKNNFDLQQQLIRKQVSIPVQWQREIHSKLIQVVKFGVNFDVLFEPCSFEDFFDFIDLANIGFNITVQIKIKYSLEELISNCTQVQTIQNSLFQIKDKISCLELYSIDKIFVQSFFRKFFTTPCKKLGRLVLHYQFDPKWHKLFSQEKEAIIQNLANVDDVCQYCSIDETDVRLLGQISFTGLVISNAGTGTRDDGYFFINDLQNHVLYPQDINKLKIGPFPINFFDNMTVQLLSNWMIKMSCLTEFKIMNFDDIFIQCFENNCLQHLTTLLLGNLRNVKNLNFLNNVCKLQSLSLEWVSHFTQSYSISFYLQTPRLKRLKLQNCSCIQEVKGIEQLKDFETLQLTNCSKQVHGAFHQELGT
eukprot:TRINITY_DN2899_c1_g1_i3.p1 TRINITY_DN2899_c1_g1~~TRINITY_DN2899_c1_g1_i3.p1  ORF type:complete len:473 (+),score=9.90 TRINITY_DN2899_c1_g1_i3:94-1512(+)